MEPLSRRTRRFTFIGVTTGKSAIMRVFPAWAEHLGQKQEESDLGDKTQARAQLQRAALARNRRPGGVPSVAP